jgi:hypothetical protein
MVTNFHKTLIVTLVLSLLSISIAYTVQSIGHNKADSGCSYLDPVTIDFLAFALGLFLVADGFHRVWEHKNDRIRKQFTRIVRISIGFAILTLHTMQFIYK